MKWLQKALVVVSELMQGKILLGIMLCHITVVFGNLVLSPKDMDYFFIMTFSTLLYVPCILVAILWLTNSWEVKFPGMFMATANGAFGVILMAVLLYVTATGITNISFSIFGVVCLYFLLSVIIGAFQHTAHDLPREEK